MEDLHPPFFSLRSERRNWNKSRLIVSRILAGNTLYYAEIKITSFNLHQAIRWALTRFAGRRRNHMNAVPTDIFEFYVVHNSDISYMCSAFVNIEYWMWIFIVVDSE